MKRRLNGCTTNKVYKRRKNKEFGSRTNEIMGFKDDYLPEWFLIEVLCRLPVKFVFRFKCVSKQWLSLISDSSFPRLYISRASALSVPQHTWTFLTNAMHIEGSDRFHFSEVKPLDYIYSGNLTSPYCHVVPLPNYHESTKKQIYLIKAVDNGVLLYDRWLSAGPGNPVRQYYICNPITKQWLSIPAHKKWFRDVSIGFITQVEDGILTSYKVALLYACYDRRNFLQFEVFSSEMGEWVEYTVSSEHSVRVVYNRKPVLFNKNLNWVDNALGIIAYDPYNHPDKFCIIEFPADVTQEYNNSRCNSICCICGVHQGRLKYFEVCHPFREYSLYSEFKIWVLEDYSSNYWYLEHTVKKENILFDDCLRRNISVDPVCFHPFHADIVYLGLGKILAAYNIRTWRLEALGIPSNPEETFCKFDYAGASCFLFVLPHWPVYIPSSLSIGDAPFFEHIRHGHCDTFNLVQGQSDPAGSLIITRQPEQPDNPWGIAAFKKVLGLATRIDPLQTSAVVSLRGWLFVRVSFERANI
ncbi:hypothetical protein ACH5RR_038122 [Cinchona calisaya]|uniref:F-box domain-containing protein n=1 Tax=Cinchona calisaya TaxID=153742 RepID=A0ABD2YDN3_9GENT